MTTESIVEEIWGMIEAQNLCVEYDPDGSCYALTVEEGFRHLDDQILGLAEVIAQYRAGLMEREEAEQVACALSGGRASVCAALGHNTIPYALDAPSA